MNNSWCWFLISLCSLDLTKGIWVSDETTGRETTSNFCGENSKSSRDLSSQTPIFAVLFGSILFFSFSLTLSRTDEFIFFFIEGILYSFSWHLIVKKNQTKIIYITVFILMVFYKHDFLIFVTMNDCSDFNVWYQIFVMMNDCSDIRHDEWYSSRVVTKIDIKFSDFFVNDCLDGYSPVIALWLVRQLFPTDSIHDITTRMVDVVLY